MKGVKRDRIVHMIVNTFGLCATYDDTEIRQMFIDDPEVGLDGETNYKRIMTRPIPMIQRMWTAVRSEFMYEEQLALIYSFVWDNIAKPSWEKYSEDQTPHKMMEINKLFLNKEMDLNSYQHILTSYREDFLKSIVSQSGVSNSQYTAAEHVSVDCSNPMYAYQSIIQSILCGVKNKYGDQELSSSEFEDAKNEVYQMIIDFIMSME